MNITVDSNGLAFLDGKHVGYVMNGGSSNWGAAVFLKPDAWVKITYEIGAARAAEIGVNMQSFDDYSDFWINKTPVLQSGHGEHLIGFLYTSQEDAMAGLREFISKHGVDSICQF